MGIVQNLRETVHAVRNAGSVIDSVNHVREAAVQSMAAFRAENNGWTSLMGTDTPMQWDISKLTTEGDRVEAATILNPLLKRGLAVRSAYIHGDPVRLSARDEQVNEVVQAFLDDESNAAVTGVQSALIRERALFTRGEFAVALFTNPMTGRVQARQVAARELTEIVTAPGDKNTRWYYRRQWTETTWQDGQSATVTREAFHPDVAYQPAARPRTINGVEVMWDAPIVHMVANTVDDLRGIGDAYPALPWANDHTAFLQDYARLANALSKIAFKASAQTPAQQARLAAQMSESARQPAGSSFTQTTGQTLEVVNKSGGTVDPAGGRYLAGMVASALGLPVTILTADPGVTGARATAETLDRPLVAEMRARQALHADFWRSVLGHVVEAAAWAPQGPLRALQPRFVRQDDRLKVSFPDTDPTIEVTYPDLEQVDKKAELDALATADALTDGHPAVKVEILKQILHVLGVQDADEILSAAKDDPVTVASEALNHFARGGTI